MTTLSSSGTWWRPSGALAVLAVAALLACGCGSSAPDKSGTSANATAAVIADTPVGRRLVDLTIRSPALHDTAKVRLLTPTGWKRGASGTRWPVLYLLHGCCDTYDSWTRATHIESWPELEHTLVVMPAGGDVGFYSNWRDGPAWETFHMSELPGLLKRGYGAGTPRTIAGLSMGGMGAMAYAARHPGTFRAAASFSGLLHPQADPKFMVGLFSAHTPDPNAIWGDPTTDRATWAQHDPTVLAKRLRGTRLFVSSGNGLPGPLVPGAERDTLIEPAVERESRAFVARLEQAGIPVTTDFYGPGTHDWPYWERELHRSLKSVLST
jgi:diacylglycerol O-acyltransferase / trehalose O-mycolyltransferase / mycolyltransferase Ag85